MKENIYRTNNCGELRITDAGKDVRLAGFVNSIRELGGLTFVTLRDQYGITQLIVRNPDLLKNVTKESTITISGKVIERESKNPKMPTGDIEIEVEKLNILGKCQPVLPFEIANAPNTKEEWDDGDQSRAEATSKLAAASPEEFLAEFKAKKKYLDKYPNKGIITEDEIDLYRKYGGVYEDL